MFHKIVQMETKHQITFTLVIGVAVVSFWRGTWKIMDYYLLPDYQVISAWISIFLGTTILLVTHHLTKKLS